jgi:NADH dehydrogenase
MPPHVVILGGGFGGLNAARTLKRAPVRVTVIDRRNHHLFQPLLYQVATAALNPSDIAQPIRRVLRRQKNAEVLLAEAVAIDRANKQVKLGDGVIDYDYLVVATGATHAYFGHDDWAACAPALKTIEDALVIRRRVLSAYEAAEREGDAAVQQSLLTFVVVGGGPTGVELAGALAEISRRVLQRDFRRIDPSRARIVLVEAGPRLLPTMHADSSERARRQLERLGAEVKLAVPVTAVDEQGVTLGGGERVPARTVLWAAGVAASPLARSLDVPLDRAGRVRVAPDLSIPGSPDVFVIGDLAALEQNGQLVPGVAPAAIQEGKHVARNLLRRVRGQPTLPFRYRDKGTLATVGRAAAVAELAGLRIGGFFAWVLWLTVHILYLIGFRNRVFVLAQWAWVYLRYERGARLITGWPPPPPPLPPRPS